MRTIALDAMGGDIGVSAVVPAAADALRAIPDMKIILVGDENTLQKACYKHGLSQEGRVEIQHASQVVAMDEAPALALRSKKDSSMRVAINLVKQGQADACVSAGNTGALMATAKFVLKTLPGIDRPAICTALPTVTGHTHMLDLGANVECSPEHLLQFAVMGAVLVEAVDNNPSPKVGLLNVGSEDTKGNQLIKAANELILQSGISYEGFIEGDDIYTGRTDVVVTDGFVGNVSLKTAEGLSSLVTHVLRQQFSRNWLTKIVAMISLPVLKAVRKQLDPRRYNGASLLGLRGIVIKSHGSADRLAFRKAIEIAWIEIEKAVPEQISHRIEPYLERPNQLAETV